MIIFWLHHFSPFSIFELFEDLLVKDGDRKKLFRAFIEWHNYGHSDVAVAQGHKGKINYYIGEAIDTPTH
jgi:hypothetical protein